LKLLERTFQKEMRYNYGPGSKTPDELNSVQEIIIINIMILKLGKYCMGKQNYFD